jgi:hypothetical protein
MAVTVYTVSGQTFPQITPTNFVLDYNENWKDYATTYHGSALYNRANIEITDMVNKVKKMHSPFISSDVKIKGILNVLGPGFNSGMLGMQLFEFCVHDEGYNWWYVVPKPTLYGHLLPHSHYRLR